MTTLTTYYFLCISFLHGLAERHLTLVVHDHCLDITILLQNILNDFQMHALELLFPTENMMGVHQELTR